MVVAILLRQAVPLSWARTFWVHLLGRTAKPIGKRPVQCSIAVTPTNKSCCWSVRLEPYANSDSSTSFLEAAKFHRQRWSSLLSVVVVVIVVVIVVTIVRLDLSIAIAVRKYLIRSIDQ